MNTLILVEINYIGRSVHQQFPFIYLAEVAHP